MNILVTILQCRRVVLPYLFLRYTLPMMRAKIDGVVTVHLVRHEYLLPDINPHETSRLPVAKELLAREWTEEGRYAPATITTHSEQFARYPSIPSRRIAAEFAERHIHDLHLWLEDDALVYDVDCADWLGIMGENRAAVYRTNAFGYINAAYYLCTSELDNELLAALKEKDRWNLNASMYLNEGGEKILNLDSPRVEPLLTKLAGKRIAHLRPEAAARHNSRKPESTAALKSLVERVCPSELGLLAIDFPNVAWV